MFRVEEAVLQRRGAAVEDKDAFRPFAFQLVTAAASTGSRMTSCNRALIVREMCCSARGSDRRWDRSGDLSFEHDAEKMQLISGMGDDVAGVSCNDLRTVR